MFYWAVRPIRHENNPAATRIEKAATPREACQLALGRGIGKGIWEAKNLGSRLAIIQSDNKRIALLRSPEGWEEIK